MLPCLCFYFAATWHSAITRHCYYYATLTPLPLSADIMPFSPCRQPYAAMLPPLLMFRCRYATSCIITLLPCRCFDMPMLLAAAELLYYFTLITMPLRCHAAFFCRLALVLTIHVTVNVTLRAAIRYAIATIPSPHPHYGVTATMRVLPSLLRRHTCHVTTSQRHVAMLLPTIYARHNTRHAIDVVDTLLMLPAATPIR